MSHADATLELVLDHLQLRGAVYCLFEGHDEWGIRLPEASEARFHAVRQGRCWLRIEDEPPVELTAGELILLPQGNRHDVVATPTSAVVDAASAYGKADPVQKKFRLGRGPTRASLICGGFSFGDADLHPVPASLPRVIRFRADDATNASLRGLLDLAHAELQGPHLASDAVLRRLSEILCIAAVRVLAAQASPGDRRWFDGLTDPVVGAALAAIHAAPARDWTVAELARAAGVSRTTLNGRFQRLVGQGPGRYLIRWRMLLARRLLEREALTVGEVADRVGYASEAAFSRAFHRELGQWPSDIRPRSG